MKNYVLKLFHLQVPMALPQQAEASAASGPDFVVRVLAKLPMAGHKVHNFKNADLLLGFIGSLSLSPRMMQRYSFSICWLHGMQCLDDQ